MTAKFKMKIIAPVVGVCGDNGQALTSADPLFAAKCFIEFVNSRNESVYFVEGDASGYAAIRRMNKEIGSSANGRIQ